MFIFHHVTVDNVCKAVAVASMLRKRDRESMRESERERETARE